MFIRGRALNIVYKILAWYFGVSVLLTGLLILIQSLFGGIFFILASFLIIPPIKEFVAKKTNKNLTVKFRTISVFILFIASGYIIQSQNEEVKELAEKQKQEKIDLFEKDKPNIVATINTAIQEEDYQVAFDKSNQYLFASDVDINRLRAKAKKEIDKLKRKQDIENILFELKSIPEKEYIKNKGLYERLLILVPDNNQYKEKLEFYSSKIEEAKQEQIKAEARKERIESQFSPWDGSHRGLEKIIKKAMNDPSSYEHDETSYWDRGDHLVVLTKYRGKNGFGGVVRGYVKAKTSLDGVILEILDEG